MSLLTNYSKQCICPCPHVNESYIYDHDPTIFLKVIMILIILTIITIYILNHIIIIKINNN